MIKTEIQVGTSSGVRASITSVRGAGGVNVGTSTNRVVKPVANKVEVKVRLGKNPNVCPPRFTAVQRKRSLRPQTVNVPTATAMLTKES